MKEVIGAPRDRATTSTRFPPVPLLSGDTLHCDADVSIVSVTVVITGDDGTAIEVPLEYRCGGWWASKAAV